MADRFPLIANSSANQIQELASGDNLNLTGSGISSVGNITSSGIVTASSFSGSGANLTGIIASYAPNSGIATYATSSGISTNAYGLTGTPDITVGIVTATRTVVNETRVLTGSEKITRTASSNSISLNYSTASSNIAYFSSPNGDITLNIVGIPTSSDFDDYSITFAAIVNSTGIARTCTAITLNGVSKSIKWVGGSLSSALVGVTTTNGQTIFTFSGINTVGSASTTNNYLVIGSVSGGFW